MSIRPVFGDDARRIAQPAHRSIQHPMQWSLCSSRRVSPGSIQPDAGRSPRFDLCDECDWEQEQSAPAAGSFWGTTVAPCRGPRPASTVSHEQFHFCRRNCAAVSTDLAAGLAREKFSITSSSTSFACRSYLELSEGKRTLLYGSSFAENHLHYSVRNEVCQRTLFQNAKNVLTSTKMDEHCSTAHSCATTGRSSGTDAPTTSTVGSSHHHDSENATAKYEAQRHDVYLMGLGMVLGGVCVNWNLGKASLVVSSPCSSH